MAASLSLAETLAPLYQEIDDGIPYDYDNVPRLKRIVNFGTNAEHPIHGWYYFKEGYAPGVVHWAFQHFLFPDWPAHPTYRSARARGRRDAARGPLVLDPFSGSGTTALTCQMTGVDALGIEYNPFFAFLGRAKLAWLHYNPDAIARHLPDLLAAGGRPGIDAPALSSFRRLFAPEALADLLVMKERINRLDDPLTRQFFQVGLAAVVERVSIARKDGKGLKVLRRPVTPAPVREALAYQWGRMLHDLRTIDPALRAYAALAQVRIEQGDARRLATVADNSVDLAVYSPPYLNSFDYAEVYKLEMWLLDFVQNHGEFRRLRGAALRSHVSTPIQASGLVDYAPLAALVDIIDGRQLWNARIPAMIRAYFDDMYLVLREQARALRRGACAVCVVANSAYGGVPIPTDVILARIGQQVGLRIEGIYIARPMNTSSQQLARWGGDRVYLRESAVVLRKE